MNATKEAGAATDELGVYQKFVCYRVDGRDQPGREREEARYFVGDYRYDPHAWMMVASYVTTCGPYHPKLSRDLARELMDVLPKLVREVRAAAVFARVLIAMGLPADAPFEDSPIYRLMDKYANGTQETCPPPGGPDQPGTQGGGAG